MPPFRGPWQLPSCHDNARVSKRKIASNEPTGLQRVNKRKGAEFPEANVPRLAGPSRSKTRFPPTFSIPQFLPLRSSSLPFRNHATDPLFLALCCQLPTSTVEPRWRLSRGWFETWIFLILELFFSWRRACSGDTSDGAFLSFFSGKLYKLQTNSMKRLHLLLLRYRERSYIY